MFWMIVTIAGVSAYLGLQCGGKLGRISVGEAQYPACFAVSCCVFVFSVATLWLVR
jgi:hypothetical protein